MKFTEINLKLSEGVVRLIRENVYCSGLAGTDGPLVHAWSKVIDALDEEKSECEMTLKVERESKNLDS